MKIRNGFVSNSSSTSFIVISAIVDGDKIRKKFNRFQNGEIIFGEKGESEFGWSKHKYNDFWSKANFSYIQARDINNNKWIEMLEKVIKDYTGATSIKCNLTSLWDDKDGKIFSYIDHHSSSVEGRNTEMFKNEDSLIRFLFSDDSFIETGNDNG